MLLSLTVSLLTTSSYAQQSAGAVVERSPQSSERGDLNLNGLAYEVADLVVYQNYFFYGLSAFDPQHIDEQIAASDINADNTLLSFRDFAYLYRIIVGDGIPFPKATTHREVAAFTQDTYCNSVSVSSPNSLAAVFLRFQGHIQPWQYAWSSSFFRTVQYDSQLDQTLMIITCPTSTSDCGGLIFRYDGSGTLIEAAAGDWLDSDLAATITIRSTAGDIGDFDGNGRLNIGDAAYMVAYVFAGGSAPVDSRHGDFTCDGATDINDAVFLLCYLFSSLNQPPCWYED